MQTATPEEVGLSSARLKRIDVAMQRFVDQRAISGAVTLVARHGKIAHFGACGLMDIEAEKPMRPDTIFRLYSMTKPITAAAVMMLFEEGHFLLDDPIADFIPEFAETKVYVGETAEGIQVADLERPITIRHLLTHTAGLTYGFSPDRPVDRMYVQARILRPDESLEEGVRRIAQLPLAHQPGSAWEYSVSIDVLGRLVEVVSGLPFDVFLKRRIFDPLGMVDTGFFVPRESQERLAVVYSPSERGGLERSRAPLRTLAEPPAFLSGGGGLGGTAIDYARFAQMLLAGGELDGERLLSRKTIELMTASQMSRAEIPFVPPGWACREGYGMALGVRTLVDVAQSGLPGSEGSYTWQGAAGTDFWVDPKEDLLGITLIQTMPGFFRPGLTLRVLVYQALVD